MTPSIRWAGPADYAALAAVMYDAVRNGPSRYTEAQRSAWVPQPREGSAWTERLDAQRIAVAESDGRVVGFMTLAADGYIDFAYIRPEAQGSGLFRRLYAAIEQRAIEAREPRLWVYASLAAEPAFAAMGFTVVERERVALGAETLDRCRMEKLLRK